MKIIAKSSSKTYLIEATSDEVDKLAGRQVCCGQYGDQRQLEYVLGTKFNITEAFAQIHRNERRRAEVKYLRDTLSAMLVGLDMVEPLIEEPSTETPEPVLAAE
jgi:hypothetical protein